MRIGFGSHVGRVRKTNEDALWCSDRVLVLADGMGGHAAGEVAAALAVQTVASWRFPDASAPLAELIAEVPRAVLAANQEVYDRSRANAAHRGMGTTITLVVLAGRSAVIGHVGDSRAYLVRDGRLTQLTEDHSVVWELVKSGGMSEHEAKRHPYRNMLTRALGTSRHIDVDVSRHIIGPGDGIFLCTDGLSGVLSDEEIAGVIGSHEAPQEAVDSLIELANARGGPDNISAILAYPEVAGVA